MAFFYNLARKDGVAGGLGGRGRKPDAPGGGVAYESFLEVTLARFGESFFS